MEKKQHLIDQLRGGLIVSCQAFPWEILCSVDVMVLLARAAEQGGAAAIRANGADNIAAIRKQVQLPIFGINKILPENYSKQDDIIITPSFDAACAVYYAGSDIIALDCSLRSGRGQEELKALITSLKTLPVLLMGEVSTLEEGLFAEACGVDIISTTIAGYTRYSRQIAEPDYELVEELVKYTKLPINAEGRYHTPSQVKRAFDCGAWAVTVGSAITRPEFITRQFVRELQ